MVAKTGGHGNRWPKPLGASHRAGSRRRPRPRSWGSSSRRRRAWQSILDGGGRVSSMASAEKPPPPRTPDLFPHHSRTKSKIETPRPREPGFVGVGIPTPQPPHTPRDRQKIECPKSFRPAQENRVSILTARWIPNLVSIPGRDSRTSIWHQHPSDYGTVIDQAVVLPDSKPSSKMDREPTMEPHTSNSSGSSVGWSSFPSQTAAKLPAVPTGVIAGTKAP